MGSYRIEGRRPQGMSAPNRAETRCQTHTNAKIQDEPQLCKIGQRRAGCLLKAGFIPEVESSDWLFPIVVVQEKNGKLRICVDFRKLNEQTIKDPFPLPFTDTMLDQIAGFQMYSFADGYIGYNQIRLALEDREKTTFITEWGAFMYLVMPFGLCNAPATFQRAMMAMFSEYLQKFMAIFVDDFTVTQVQRSIWNVYG